MGALFGHIRSLIEKRGPMSLATYMELALQHPDYGYYRHGDPLGRAGDFITAPEISQMFGEMIGLWCAEAWRAMGKPAEFALCELGPGRGTLLADALRATAKIHGFHAALKLFLLESSVSLRAVQMEKLAAHQPVFVDSLASLPSMPALVIANEFFDALPIRQFENTAEGWRERLVTVAGEEFEFVLSPPDPAFAMLIPADVRAAPAGTVHEASLPALALMRQLAARLVAHGGAALIIDYGYAAPPGESTLQALSQHRHADVLEKPGEVDLTAHVDFAALRHVAERQGARVFGPVGQGEFLQALGIEMRALQLKHNATPDQASAIDAALPRLCDPAHMGALFKAMAVVVPGLGELAGF
ncbi:MAG TPA: SAM-dependent methyltransferase [Alphaproteobacteria bacterium]|nr:SAM-dependent methyltransferase [Alphaproteobacteria bacterium]